MSARFDDIRQKLSYMLRQYELLEMEIRAAEKDDQELEHLGIRVGEIIGGCRECLDYCLKDLLSEVVELSGGALKNAYFPFSLDAINRDTRVFPSIRKIRPDLYKFLVDLADKIDNSAEMEGLGFFYGYGFLRQLNNLVNEKKHDKVTRSAVHKNAKTLIEHPSGASVSMEIFDLTDGVKKIIPAIPVLTNTDSIQKPISTLMVGDFKADEVCRLAIKSVSQVVTSIYEGFFNIEDPEVDPWELRKSFELRLGEKVLKSASPLRIRPVRLALFREGECVFALDCDESGKFITSDVCHSLVVSFLLEIYRSRVMAHVMSEFRGKIKKEPTHYSAKEVMGTPLISAIRFPVVHSLETENGEAFGFDEIRFEQFGWVRQEGIVIVPRTIEPRQLWHETLRALFGDMPQLQPVMKNGALVLEKVAPLIDVGKPLRVVISGSSSKGINIHSLENVSG